MTRFSNFNSGPGTKYNFEIANVDLSIVNSIRRVILADIPNVAFAFDPYDEAKNDVVFLDNSSALHNEFMGHRVSLIPINLTLQEIKNWGNTDFNFEVKVKNVGTEKVMVTSHDISVLQNGTSVKASMRDRLFPANEITGEHILITKLKPNPFNAKEGEALHCQMTARLGSAKEHARWSHVSLCTYINLVDEKAADRAYNEMIKTIDPSLTEEEKNRAINRFNCIDRNRIFYKNEYDEPNRFKFMLETVNSMMLPHELVTEALSILINKMISVPSEEKSEIHVLNADDHLYMIKIRDEGHTIGNLIQSLVYNLYIRDKPTIQYVGYYQPHPLENDVVIKLRHNEISTTEGVRRFVQEASDKIVTMLEEILKEWQTATQQVPKNRKKK